MLLIFSPSDLFNCTALCVGLSHWMGNPLQLMTDRWYVKGYLVVVGVKPSLKVSLGGFPSVVRATPRDGGIGSDCTIGDVPPLLHPTLVAPFATPLAHCPRALPGAAEACCLLGPVELMGSL